LCCRVCVILITLVYQHSEVCYVLQKVPDAVGIGCGD